MGALSIAKVGGRRRIWIRIRPLLQGIGLEGSGQKRESHEREKRLRQLRNLERNYVSKSTFSTSCRTERYVY